MEVVINNCFGGFGLSDEAVELCIQKGMICTTCNEQGVALDETADFVKRSEAFFDSVYYCPKYEHKKFRSNPIVVEVVKTLGEKAFSILSKLKVVEIPFETTDGWQIDDHDGFEKIVECHRSWS